MTILSRFAHTLILFHLTLLLHAQDGSNKLLSLDHNFLSASVSFSDSACKKASFENFLITDSSYIFCGRCVENNELSYFRVITDKEGNKLFEDYQDYKHSEISNYKNLYTVKDGMISFSWVKVNGATKIQMLKLTPHFKPTYKKVLEIDSVWGSLLTTPINGGGYYLITEKKDYKRAFTLINLDEEGDILWRKDIYNSDTNTYERPEFIGESNNNAIVGITRYKYNRSNPIWRKLVRINKDKYKLIEKDATGNMDFINGTYFPIIPDSLNIFISTKNFYKILDVDGQLLKAQKLSPVTQSVALIHKSHLYRIGYAHRGGAVVEKIDYENDKTVYSRFVPHEMKNGKIRFAKYDKERERLTLLFTARNTNYHTNSKNRLVSVNCEGFTSLPVPSFNYFSNANKALIYPTIQNADKAIIDYGDGTNDTIYSRNFTDRTLLSEVMWGTIQHTYPDTGIYVVNVSATCCGITKQLSDTVVINDEIPYKPLYSDFFVQRNLRDGEISKKSVEKIIKSFQTAAYSVQHYHNKPIVLTKIKELIENDLKNHLVELYPVFYNGALSGELFYSVSQAYKAIGKERIAIIWLKQAYNDGVNISPEEKLILEEREKSNFHVFNEDTIYNEDYMKVFKYDFDKNNNNHKPSVEYLKPQEIKEYSGYDVNMWLTKNKGDISSVDRGLNKIRVRYTVRYNGDTLIKNIYFYKNDKKKSKRYANILFQNGKVTGVSQKRSNFLGYFYLTEFDKYENIIRKSVYRKTWLPRRVNIRTGPFSFKKKWMRISKHVKTKKYNPEGEIISVKRGERK